MHGRGLRKLTPYMPSTTTTTSNTGVIDSNGSSGSGFVKDGRKISVGDCALFKPAEDSPPFVGVIRCWTSERGSILKLRVNWLYRPADVKLLKGIALEAAPNEVFYSFHSDEIPAASLLHPCKVAFLRKGVELPPGISSFVCRRVYDIKNKCLQWLTDQHCIDDRHKEVNQLLHKTHLEMHASEEQQCPRSPKPENGSATSALKHSPDSVQNSSSNLSSLGKGKKRDRGDQSFDANKRERSSKPHDGNSGQLKSDSMLNAEIAKFSDKGGLVDSEAVARLVQLMQPEKSEKKIDLTARCMLAGVIAATDKFDCLNKFVELRGLLILNEWIQEVHKGKINNSGNLRNCDKSVDDYLLVLLRALDKLPVNLDALQMCNIGKSVNHLRSHRNSEVQKKARSLVDTWKKRVEDEMLIIEEGRSQHGSSHGGSRYPCVSDAVVRSPITHQSSVKSTSRKHVPDESNSNSTSAHPGGTRSTLSPTSTTDNWKDGQSQINATGGSLEPQVVAKEEKSSSSSPSHTNSQCSSDHAKSKVSCGKEDTRRSTAGSRSSNKVLGTTKHSKSANCLSSGTHRETALNKSSSMPKYTALEKVSHSAVDASVQESNNHKLIVKIPNRSQGPAQSSVAISLEDSSSRNSIASSPAFSERHDQSDALVRGNKHDADQFLEVDGSSTIVHTKTIETKRSSNVSKIGCSPSRNEIKSRKVQDSSFSSMNALIESCAQISEANVSLSAGDDVGMNLLASVAAREISKSCIVSPTLSPHRSSKIEENFISNHVADQEQLLGGDVIQQGQPSKIADTQKLINGAGVPKVDEDVSKLCNAKAENIQKTVGGCLKNNGKSVEKVDTVSTSVSVTCTTGRSVSDLGVETIKGELKSKEENHQELPVASQKVGGSLEAQDKVKPAMIIDEFDKKDRRDSASCPPNDDDEKINANQVPQSNVALEESTFVAVEFDPANTIEKPVMASGGTNEHFAAKRSIEVNFEKTVAVLCDPTTNEASNRILENETCPSASDKQVEMEGCYAGVDRNRSCEDENLENEECDASALPASRNVAWKIKELHLNIEGSKLTAVAEEIKEKSALVTENVAVSPASGGPDFDSKFGFDLNEGCSVDEGKFGEPSNLAAGMASPLQIPFISTSCGLPAPITVVSPAKGAFVPLDDLCNKRELGWKGSAATSAFRPAEPRKAIDVPPGPSKAPLSDVPACRPARLPLDIDLNVADESSGQELVVVHSSVCDHMTTASLRSPGGLDLDLNKVDEAPDMVHMGRYMASNTQRVDASTQHVNPSLSNDGAATGKRDFDLNDGPATEEMPFEQILSSQHNRSHVPFQIPLGSRISRSDTGNGFPWYPSGTSYSLNATQSALPDREAFSIVGIGSGPQRVMGGSTPALTFNADAYRGSVLSSSPALPFHSAPFQYPVLPFGASFPLHASALAGGSSEYMDPATGGRISAIPSQLVGNAAAISFQYPHAYAVSRSIPDIVDNVVVESSHNWGKQGLDLNSGPGVLDIEGRDGSLPTVSRQVTTFSSLSLPEEQARIFSTGGGHQKRKEPEGGLNIDKLNFKQSSWR